MPNRILKESICTSDSVDGLSWFEEVLFYRLIVNCDDYGRFDGRTAVIKNRLFPLKEKLSSNAVEASVMKLAACGLVTLYTFEGKPYLQLTTWERHQTIRAKKSKFPSPEGLQANEINCMQLNANEINCKQMHANVPVIQSESESNTNAEKAKRKRFAPPTHEEVRAYCDERKNGVDAEKFIAYYEANGWHIGKNPMKNWKAAVRSWEKNEFGEANGTKRENKPVSFSVDEALSRAMQRTYGKGEQHDNSV